MADQKPVAVDFETEAIQPRPHYPPRPVGVAIKWPGRKAKYLAWGHPEGNNSTKADAIVALNEVCISGRPVVFHHAQFDQDVMESHMGLLPLDPARVRDTMVMGFLNDPHARQLQLKELGAKLLGREPTERDRLRDWVLANVPEARAAKKQWGAHISKAPADLVAPYACADTDFTAELHDALWKKICDAGMCEAHLREMRLIPVLLENERLGIRVDLPRLERDVALYKKQLEKADLWVRKYLGTPILNVDSGEELADAVSKRYPEAQFLTTPTGQRSTSKESLSAALDDKKLVAVLEYRSTLSTCLSTFMEPWLAVAQETNGWIHTRWRATAQETGGGTRTGRLASSPNFQNIPTNEKVQAAEAGVQRLKWPYLPRVRSYIVPDDDGSIIIDRDFSQQEPRILAHYEDDRLAEAYRENPRMDVYISMGAEVKTYAGIEVPRKPMKTLVLALIYGIGNGTLAERLNCTVGEAMNIKNALLRTYPGIKDLIRDLKACSGQGIPMRTWGGRVYYSEPSKVIDGRVRDFGYKLVNYLIQGTAGDMMKEALIRYHDHPKRRGRFLITAHDEVAGSTPLKHEKAEMKTLRESMEGIGGFDVPFTSDGTRGFNWSELEDCE